ncbi:MAG: hypothetical protein ACOCYV_01350 [Planctomycetota bacterium]
MGARIRLGTWRIAIYIVIILVIVAFRVWSDWRGGGKPAPRWHIREATAEEWDAPITELGERQQAKQVVWRFVRHDMAPDYDGMLVYWHDGEAEQLGYLPQPGEDPQTALSELIVDLRRGRGPGQPPPAMIFIDPADPPLRGRLLELVLGSDPLPAGWTVLTPPDPLPADVPPPAAPPPAAPSLSEPDPPPPALDP